MLKNNNLSDKLDIFLITFNRAKRLDKTLEQLLSLNSPINDFVITILDNNSTDETALVVQKWQVIRYKKYKDDYWCVNTK